MILEGMEYAGFKITTMNWIDDYDQSFQEGERAYAEEFRKKLSPKNLSDFYESDEQSIPLSIWKSSAAGRCRKIKRPIPAFTSFRDRQEKVLTVNSVRMNTV